MAIASAILGGIAGFSLFVLSLFYFGWTVLAAFGLYVSSGTAVFVLCILTRLAVDHLRADKARLIGTRPDVYLRQATSHQNQAMGAPR